MASPFRFRQLRRSLLPDSAPVLPVLIQRGSDRGKLDRIAATRLILFSTATERGCFQQFRNGVWIGKYLVVQ